MLSVRKGDMVQVVSGNHKGETGKILHVDLDEHRVLVEKLNMVKRHVKPSQQNPQGGVIQKEAPLHVSKVLLFCPKCSKGVRTGVKWVEAGKKKEKTKARACKKCNEVLDSI